MPSWPTTLGNCIRCWSEAEKPANRFRATRFWRTSPQLRSDTSTFRGFIAFRWSAIWTASYRQCSLERSPPAQNDLSTGNRYFWRVLVNTPCLRGRGCGTGIQECFANNRPLLRGHSDRPIDALLHGEPSPNLCDSRLQHLPIVDFGMRGRYLFNPMRHSRRENPNVRSQCQSNSVVSPFGIPNHSSQIVVANRNLGVIMQLLLALRKWHYYSTNDCNWHINRRVHRMENPQNIERYVYIPSNCSPKPRAPCFLITANGSFLTAHIGWCLCYCQSRHNSKLPTANPAMR